MVNAQDKLKLDNQVCFRLYRASRKVIRLYQPILAELNITYPQYITMLVMWEEETIDFKALGARLELTTGTLTPIVQRLEGLGYVVREKNPEDHRKVWVKLTPAGKKIKESAYKIPELLLKNMDMDMEKYIRYISVLDELGDILSQAEEKKKSEV